jgi:RecA/RadA recombinase
MEARLNSKFFARPWRGLFGNSCVTLLMVNQFRDSLKPFSAPNTTPGGKAIRYFSHLRLRLSKKENIETAQEGVVGHFLDVDVEKSKISRKRDVKIPFYSSGGLNNLMSFFYYMSEYGSWMEWDGKRMNKAQAITLFQDPLQYAVLRDIVKQKYHGEAIP